MHDYSRGSFCFAVNKEPILNSIERERWETELKLKALPDILFGQNSLQVSYRPDKESEWRKIIQINCYESLQHVCNDRYPFHLLRDVDGQELDNVTTLDDVIKRNGTQPLELSYASSWRSSR
jgi:hypothetical protein